MVNDDSLWQIFVARMGAFKNMYLAMAKHANTDLMYLLAIKNLVEVQKPFNENNKKESDYFKDLLRYLNSIFDIDAHIEKLNANFICLRFSPKSKHFLTYGNFSLCGKFIKVLSELETQLLSESGAYKKEISHIGFRLEHKIGETIDIAYWDLSELEFFKN